MKKKSNSPEVQKAMDVRDELMADVKTAVAKVDKLVDELLKQYEEAQGGKR